MATLSITSMKGTHPSFPFSLVRFKWEIIRRKERHTLRQYEEGRERERRLLRYVKKFLNVILNWFAFIWSFNQQRLHVYSIHWLNFFFLLFFLSKIEILLLPNLSVCAWNSFLETWTSALISPTIQELLLVKWSYFVDT